MESNINWEDIKVWYAPHNGGIFIGEVKNGKSVNISEDMQKQIIFAVCEKLLCTDYQKLIMITGNESYELRLRYEKIKK